MIPPVTAAVISACLSSARTASCFWRSVCSAVITDSPFAYSCDYPLLFLDGGKWSTRSRISPSGELRLSSSILTAKQQFLNLTERCA